MPDGSTTGTATSVGHTMKNAELAATVGAGYLLGRFHKAR